MKIIELLNNQSIIVQLLFDKQKIEFESRVIDNDGTAVFITPYIHNGKELELNITNEQTVVCNIFAFDNITNQRISWRGVELLTENRNNRIVYCLKAHSFNNISNLEDRREHERILVKISANVFDGQDTLENVTIHDISDNGMAFCTSDRFEPKSRQITIDFDDQIGEKKFKLNLVCDIARISTEDDCILIGCRILGENKDYQTYEFLKRLCSKYKIVSDKDEKSEKESEEQTENQTEERLSA